MMRFVAAGRPGTVLRVRGLPTCPRERRHDLAFVEISFAIAHVFCSYNVSRPSI
jgi:hypothetical protein